MGESRASGEGAIPCRSSPRRAQRVSGSGLAAASPAAARRGEIALLARTPYHRGRLVTTTTRARARLALSPAARPQTTRITLRRWSSAPGEPPSPESLEPPGSSCVSPPASPNKPVGSRAGILAGTDFRGYVDLELPHEPIAGGGGITPVLRACGGGGGVPGAAGSPHSAKEAKRNPWWEDDPEVHSPVNHFFAPPPWGGNGTSN